jgi:hypothetical protein
MVLISEGVGGEALPQRYMVRHCSNRLNAGLIESMSQSVRAYKVRQHQCDRRRHIGPAVGCNGRARKVRNRSRACVRKLVSLFELGESSSIGTTAGMEPGGTVARGGHGCGEKHVMNAR